MEMRDLLEKMMKFAGEKVGQKPGEQWRGSDKAPPGKKLVGDSILKDLSKGPTPKSKEQELAEEFQAFLEAEFKDTVDKRPRRKSDRHPRGHEPKSGYKTIKADEAAGKGFDYHDQIPIKSVMQGISVDYNRKTNQTVLSYRGKPIETFIYDGIPTLGHFDVAVDHKIAELMKLGKIPKMPSLPRNRSSQPQTYNPDQEYSHGIDLPKNVQQQMFQQHDQDTEDYGMVSVSNPAKWANVNAKKEKEKEKQQKVAESSMSEKDIELQDYRSMSHKEFQTAYGMTKTEWMNKNKALVIKNPDIKKALGLEEDSDYGPVEARWIVKVEDDEGQHLKTFRDEFPNLEAAKKAYEKHEPYASDFKYKRVKKEQVEEAVYTAPTTKDQYDAKMSALQDLQNDPNTANDPELQKKIIIYMDNLQKIAHQKGWTTQSAEESRGHKVIATKLKNIERERKFASGELKIPTPQERQAQLKKLEKEKPVKEYGASNVTPYGQPAVDPKKAAQVAQGAQAFKAATGITAPATNIAKALDDASQGKPADRTSMKVLEPAMQDLITIMSDPKLGNEFKSLAQKVNQKQQKPQ